MSRDDLSLLYGLLIPKLDISKFLKVGDDKKVCKVFVFRGLICYYGLHYYAYFYSEKYDTWFRFDDNKIVKCGNW